MTHRITFNKTFMQTGLAAILLAVLLSSANARAANADTNAAAAVNDERLDTLQLERLKRAKAKAKKTDAFTAKSWRVPTPTPTPPPPPPPTAPPVPFAYMGKQVETDGNMTIFLSQGDRMHMVKPGDMIDNTYSIDAIENGRLVLTYLPLQIKQYVNLGE